jgi:hypothetical protein
MMRQRPFEEKIRRGMIRKKVSFEPLSETATKIAVPVELDVTFRDKMMGAADGVARGIAKKGHYVGLGLLSASFLSLAVPLRHLDFDPCTCPPLTALDRYSFMVTLSSMGLLVPWFALYSRAVERQGKINEALRKGEQYRAGKPEGLAD